MLVGLHDGFGPFSPARFPSAGTHGDLQHVLIFLLLRVVVPDEAAVDLELAQIVVGRHVAAAIPAFVADAEEGDLIGSRMSVYGALFRQRGQLSGRQVFEPFRCLLRSAGADVD